MNEYKLYVQERVYSNNSNIKAENEELALYQAFEDLELMKGVEWVKNGNKGWYRKFNSLEEQLREKGSCSLAEGVWIEKIRFNKKVS